MNAKYILTLLSFLCINFGGLAIGSIWINPGTSSEWYTSLTQPPWAPPGFVFGLAWTTIGITFSMLMTHFWINDDIEPLVLFPFAFLLNIMWGMVFFGMQSKIGGIFVLGLLAMIIYYMTDFAKNNYGWKIAWLGLPYYLWLMIASSINIYIAVEN